MKALIISADNESIMKNNYWSPYIVGVLLGLTLLSTFYLMGWGLGVSSAVSKFTAYVLHIPFPEWVEKNQYFGTYFKEGQPLNDWWVFEVSGMFVGGLIGSITARRFNIKVERGGLGNPRKLTAIFYLEDFTVLKVMFSAIVTAGVGLWILSKTGALDMGRVLVVPTYLWPQLIGGFILGIGFVIGGYCPGTSVIGITSGRGDAAVFFIGLMSGMGLFAWVFPWIKGFYLSGDMGDITLQRWMGIPTEVLIAGILIMAFLSVLLAERIERHKRQ